MPASTKSSTQDVARTPNDRLDAVRGLMARHQLDAYLVPSSDEHLNEYLPEAHKRREWISGFTGSAGDFLLTPTQGFAFVDSRYYEQAEYEVDTTRIHINKVGLEGHCTLKEQLEQLVKQAGRSYRLGYDPATLALEQYQDLKRALAETSIEWVALAENLVDAVWQSQQPPAPVLSSVVGLPESVTGESVQKKLARVREMMARQQVAFLPVLKLDQVAWLYNLRGQDIPYNPVFLSYGLVTSTAAYLFTEPSRIAKPDREALAQWVTVLPYEAYGQTLLDLLGKQKGARVLLDPKHSTCATAELVRLGGAEAVERDHPVQRMKAVKNPAELAGMRLANLKASRAKIRALKWLWDRVEGSGPAQAVSEVDFQEAIEAFYAEEPEFAGLSFNTIAGAGANSSIVHYGTPNPKAKLLRGQLFLIDSGAQFAHGTTDDTRTVIVGKPTPRQRKCYTEVLKAHINCAMQRFPKGTEGIRLDGITRATLWNAGLDYGHGTGHGVGAYLNVHEGPNGIHRLAKEPFVPGMITSIEPGYYEPGWGGIRLENLYETVEVASSPERTWYGFETLTYVPFDKRLIVKSALTREQWRWLVRYHAAIVSKIASTLPPKEAAWLKRYCDLGASPYKN
jgi:Xaa-Pro aminopeptidase